MASKYGRVKRAFYHSRGVVHKVGEVHEYPEQVAIALRTSGKIDYCEPPQKVEPKGEPEKVEQKAAETTKVSDIKEPMKSAKVPEPKAK